MYSTLLEVTLATVIAGSLTFLFLSVFARRGIVDVPNARSSHSVVVPRGGGFSIVLTFLAATLVLALRGALARNLATALIGGGLLVAGAGLADDTRSLPVWTRLLVHFAAAAWAVSRVGGVALAGPEWNAAVVSWLERALAVAGLVWMVNLYNFMDGIDGLAGLEGVCAAALGSFLLVTQGYFDLAQVALLLAAVCAGFLIFNWPPAKIFMGDVGSGFLGFTFGVLAIASSQRRSSLVWVWLILLGVFIVDATLTLVRRMARGERWYSAHRSHAYQHASRLWGSHKKVTLAVGGLNVIWLFPMARLAEWLPNIAPMVALIAAVPLTAITLFCHAGDSEQLSGNQEVTNQPGTSLTTARLSIGTDSRS